MERAKRCVTQCTDKRSGFLLYELLISLVLFTVFFSTTAIILHNSYQQKQVIRSKEILAFESIKNRIEHDLLVASNISVTETTLNYTINGRYIKYYSANAYLFCREDNRFMTIKSHVQAVEFKKVDNLIQITFTTSDQFKYKVLVLYEAT